MRWNRISLKLGVTILLLLLIVLLPLGFVIDQIFLGFYYSQVQEDIDELSSLYAEAIADSPNSMIIRVIEMMGEFSQVPLYIVNAEGQLIANSGVPGITSQTRLSAKELETLAEGQSIKREYQDTGSGHRFLVSGAPVHDEDTFLGGVYVLSSIEDIYQSIDQVRQVLILSGIGTFFLALGVIVVLSRKLSSPLLQMEQATRKIAKGDLNTRVKVTTGDEVGTLAQAINDLAVDLKRYRETRSEFFANISHELRTPITYLEGYAHILKENLYQSEEEKEQYVEIIHQESARLTRLIHDVFELSKMEEGKINLNQEWMDILEIMETILPQAELKAKKKGLQLKADIQENLPCIYADGLRMEQILMNLVDNAIQYTNKGAVCIEIRHVESGELMITIKDSGKGIPEDELPYIFERFYRVEKSRSREYGGTGLGLAIVKQFVDMQGGSLTVSSEVGKGTQFKILFPTNKKMETEGESDEKD